MISYSSFFQGIADTLDLSIEQLKELELSGESAFDSMGKINVALYIEETFGWQIPLTVLDQCTTVEGLYNIVLNSVEKSDA